MAPWTRHVIETQLDKINVHNYDDIAKRIVGHLDARATVRQLAIMVVRSANRWYTPTFHKKLDSEKRNLCDQFVASLVHAMALRTKLIRDVPTPEGLSGIPLLKADLLSVWIYRRMSIGPVATALFNSGNLTVDDLVVVLRACLDTSYLVKFNHIGDTLLLLEHGGRQLDTADPDTFSALFAKVKGSLDAHVEKASVRRKIGDRTIPSLFDRYSVLVQKRQEGWRISPYGAELQMTGSGVSGSGEVQNSNADERAAHDDALQRTSTLASSGTDDEVDSSYPHTPPLNAADLPQQDDDDNDNDTREGNERNTADTTRYSPPFDSGSFDAFWHGGSFSASHAPDVAGHIESPWNAYFAPRPAKSRRSRGPLLSSVAATESQSVDTMADVSPRRSRRTSDASPLATAVSEMKLKEVPPVHVDAEIMPRRVPSASTTRRHSTTPTVAVSPFTSSTVAYVGNRTCHPGHSEALARLLAPRGSLPENSISSIRANEKYAASVVDHNTPSSQRAPRRRTRSSQSAVTSQNQTHRKMETIDAHVQTMPSSTLSRAYEEGVTDGRSSALKSYPATFEGDATWIELEQPQTSPVRVRFPSNFLIGDAQRVAHIFARALKHGVNPDNDSNGLASAATPSSAQATGQLHFTPGGAVMEEFAFGDKAIHVEYPSSMTLAQARDAGQRLAFVAAHLAV